MAQPDFAGHYWLLEGGVPVGPFSPEAIRQRLGSGDLSPDSLVCAVGGSAWSPARSVTAISAETCPAPPALPGDPVSTATTAAPTEAGGQITTAVSPAPPREEPARPALVNPPKRLSVPRPSRDTVNLVVGAVILAIVGYALYSFFRELTPREVCERLHAANSVDQGKAYCTPRMLEAARAMERALAGQPDDGGATELTYEQAAPTHVGGYFVGVRMITRDEYGRPVEAEGVYHLIRQGTWKVDDLLLLAYDRQRFEQPVSLALNYREIFGAAGTPISPGGSGAVGKEAASWWDNPNHQKYASNTITRFLAGPGGKAAAVAVIALGAGLVSLVSRRKPVTNAKTT